MPPTFTSYPKVNTLIQGPIGTGKSHSLRSLVELGLELFVISTEPGIEHLLGDTDPARCHWHYVAPANPDWDVMLASANAINTLSQSDLQKTQGNRIEYRQFIEFLSTCANFTCDRTGQQFGPIDSFGTDRCVAWDGLSGLSIMAMDLVCGNKPIKTLSDWGVAMDNLERSISKATNNTQCSFVLTAHVEREIDEVFGGTKINVSTLGKKLAPKIPRFFDEVVQAVRVGDQFHWSNMDNGVDLKKRLLPFGEDLAPNFTLLYKRALEQAGSSNPL
jgi:hypothetical protein